MKILCVFVVSTIFCLIDHSQAIIGWDGIQAVDVEGFQCLSQNGFEFYIGRIWNELGEPSPDGIQNIINARQAGVKSVDGYIYPCMGMEGCASASEQMEGAINAAKEKGAEMGTIWIDIESADDWPKDEARNQQFISELIQKADQLGVQVGIYTSSSQWNPIVGVEWNGAANKMLWYALWDDNESFEGFEPFGGWQTPTYHQFSGQTDGPCGVKMDKNFRESL